jgi:hypothetical protein
VFISAALNTLADEGQHIVEVGAYQAVGRQWAGNTHRDLRWFDDAAFCTCQGRSRYLKRSLVSTTLIRVAFGATS